MLVLVTLLMLIKLMARIPLKPSTIKQLFAHSGNECAFQNCIETIVTKEGVILGEICHIEAAEKGGERYNPISNDEFRRSFANLILFCPKHHKITNDVKRYPVSKLTEMKTFHENKFKSKAFTVSDQIVENAIVRYMSIENKDVSVEAQIINQANSQSIGNQIVTQHIHNYSNDNDADGKSNIADARKVIKSLKKLIDDNHKIASPPDSWVIDYQNELKDKIPRNVELVPVKFLKFRKNNGRIKADVESYEKSTGFVLDESSEDTQKILKSFLSGNDKEKNEELKKLLIHKGQKDPAIITCDGFLINGNRRKMALEELYDEKNQDPKYEMMRVVILPEGVTELDVQKIENRYQLQGEGKSEYHGLNRALTIKRNMDKGFTLEAQLNDDPNYHGLSTKEFAKTVDEYKKKFLNPLNCVDRYLNLFDRDGLYNTISESSGDREGRWQAFIDYSNFYYNTLENKTKLAEYKIKESEVRKIENAIFKIIRKRSLNSKELESSIGKLHDFVRKAPKYIRNPEAKKILLKIADEVDEDLPKEMLYNKEGHKLEERDVDEHWGNHFKRQILGNLIQAHRIVANQVDRDKPLELLEDALKKLRHENLKIDQMDTSYYERAMELSTEIIAEADAIHVAVDHARYELKKLSKKK